MQGPLLTVLMPVHNAAQFIAEAMDSILVQTFTSFEFLIIDDGSTDETLSIIESYTDNRIRLLKNEKNLGISATLNKGIESAQCELIARMDADDISHPERLQLQYEYMTAHPDTGMVACWAQVINEQKELIRKDEFDPEYYYYNITFICWLYHPTVMYRKSAVKNTGGYTVPYSEDYELFWQLYRAIKVHVLPFFLLDYRVTSQSLHQVIKKEEYHIAQQQQVRRNIAFYMGRGFALSNNQLECLRHNFTPLLQENNLFSLLYLLHKLKKITARIIQTPNINLDARAVKKAAFHKRKFIVGYFSEQWSKPKGLLLLASTFSWSLLFSSGKYYILKNFNKKTLPLK